MTTRRTRKNSNAAATKPAPVFANGARVTAGENAGTVISTEITADDFGRDIWWQMATVQWDDGRSDVMNPACLEAEITTEEQRFARDYDRAVAFAREHD